MHWMATHRIVYVSTSSARDTIEVMALDRGVDAPGPGRYGLYTEEEWGAESEPDWSMDGDGRPWYRGGPPPGEGTARVEGVWDSDEPADGPPAGRTED